MFKIFTDTGADLPDELVRRYDLGVLPLSYTVDGVEYPSQDSPDTMLKGKPFYDALRNGADSHTSMVNIAAFCEAFEECLVQGVDVLYIGMSSGVSGTYQASALAVQELAEQYPQRKIMTLDTRAASLGEGLPVLYAAQLKDAGSPLEEVAAKTREDYANICQYFTVEDLMYLKKGGRISGAAALLGNILQIKPILMGTEAGEIALYRKERGWKRTLEALAAIYGELVADRDRPMGIAHADNPEAAELLAGKLRERGQRGEIHTVFFDPVTGSHVGPGAVALFFYGIHR
jgi:DegV family protein with EDD domain